MKVPLPIYRHIDKKHNKLQKMIKCHIKEDSIQNGNCIKIPYSLLFRIICLQNFVS